MDFIQKDFAPPYSIFDTHAHYDDHCFDDFRDELLSEIGQKGVGYIINNATNLTDSAKACLEMSEKYDFCYTTVGIHPEAVETEQVTLDEELFNTLLSHKKTVAVGEIGLDYHYSDDNKELQKKVFFRQCEIAVERDLPVIVHDREAHGDTMDILREIKPKGSVHCFSGSAEMALELVKLGMHIGVGGVVTFNNARKLVEAVQAVPLKSILLETDAPYIAPVPYRGKMCHSAYIYYTASRIAEIKGVSLDEVLAVTTQNAKQLFKIK